MTAARADDGAVRIVRGVADAAELAALTVVLHVLARHRGAAPVGPSGVSWDRQAGARYRPASSWRA
ncbi:acyl-CoA carboxylase epsilon subunit [Streptomyces sp. H10-C2]|uniref:acyl-CoA carboxylase epsilon subunit n=1 Tax=unclassified Streptomyces TaxID=2593676 RepID=UPI0024BBBE63|nr:MULTISPECIES: acyl-CoA carboxylase epsilon subunit [unclassified Streptomyces]MDJ0346529.1 acyl-CoA carboxylase epsilon subunit [Streptomyces sp. PH10-H1]MDJ0374334.1 acyl-CoA carboxylase epsilon subunit [Streptomyces sp. H10-C2]